MKRLFRWMSVLCAVVLCTGLLTFARPAMAMSAGQSFGMMQPMLLAADVEKEALRNKVADKMSTDFGKKLDLNNTNLRYFRVLQGMYPTLAGLIVKNSPYKAVEDVLKIPGLTETQRTTLERNLDKFTVTDVEEALTAGDDRINNGAYR
jgi:photosystem II PsbU protein